MGDVCGCNEFFPTNPYGILPDLHKYFIQFPT